ncbi:MAG: polyphosphate polymerase domain-containing protein [Clostridia bacterium]|nr:polyphosphate polymerase domain-containing protein [Clostridia bacterium]
MIIRNPVVAMQRFELKYLVTPEQKAFFLRGIEGRLNPDGYGRTRIGTLYYDTPDRRIVNASIERPFFKEKIRLRSYGPATDETPAFLEIKRKAYGIVYKRRVVTTVPLAEEFFSGADGIFTEDQIGREITAFRDFYGVLSPSCLITCDRAAYVDKSDAVRVTVDNDPRFRTDALDLTAGLYGEPLLPGGVSILEVKVRDAVPLWLSRLLDSGKIRKCNFSKYGEAYKRQMSKTTVRAAPGAGAGSYGKEEASYV